MDPETNNTSDQEDDTEVFAVNLEPIVEIDENIDLGEPVVLPNDNGDTKDLHKEFPCYTCGNIYQTLIGLNRHKKTHEKDPINTDLDHENIAAINNKPKKEFPCDKCGIVLASIGSLYNHKKRHDKKIFTCHICNETFPFYKLLTSHKKEHNGKKLYNCDICGKSYSHSSTLSEHKRTHDGRNNHICLICGRCFPQRLRLIEHERIHTGEKPFKCDQCDKSFSLKGYLTEHKRIHTGEKPYSCDICFKTFTQSGALYSHKKFCSEDNKCEKCDGLVFLSKKELILHEKSVHRGKQSFSCDICGKTFLKIISLEKHKSKVCENKDNKRNVKEESAANENNFVEVKTQIKQEIKEEILSEPESDHDEQASEENDITSQANGTNITENNEHKNDNDLNDSLVLTTIKMEPTYFED